MNVKKEVWDRQKRETHKSYSAFSVYRNLGPIRSLEKAARIFYEDENLLRSSGGVRLFDRWSSNNNWVARAEAWDTEQDKLNRLEQREAIREMNKRHASYGMAMQQKGMTYLLDLDTEKLTPDQASRLTKTGVEIERPARGEAIIISEHKVNANVKIINIQDTLKKYEEEIDAITEEVNG